MNMSVKSICRGRVARAFSLTELLVVMAIIGILTGILIPVVGSIRDRANTLQCQGNLRQIHAAMLLYVSEHNDWLPPGPNNGGLTVPQHANYRLGINNVMTTHLSPYMDLPLDNNVRLNKAFFCPAQPEPATVRGYSNVRTYGIMASYANGINYPFGYLSSRPSMQMHDYMEKRNPAVTWMLRDIDQEMSPINTVAPNMAHRGGRNYLYFDGSIKLLSPEMEQQQADKIAQGGW
ncbi:MAG: prepilin-type N-terminal cleavage/methylation domain-containing protein [Verrucomicrobiota bacterium JB024]|jgi:prepilin-type N-terminal cleavage/methylation domain-containing protein/prepilin-type processing-associated H-X9-DG protein|nr:prepilin-type N-terminal cleavage/methylation domain-containing protein [Verrucomicrobiota bacterium JB024]